MDLNWIFIMAVCLAIFEGITLFALGNYNDGGDDTYVILSAFFSVVALAISAFILANRQITPTTTIPGRVGSFADIFSLILICIAVGISVLSVIGIYDNTDKTLGAVVQRRQVGATAFPPTTFTDNSKVRSAFQQEREQAAETIAMRDTRYAQLQAGDRPVA